MIVKKLRITHLSLKTSVIVGQFYGIAVFLLLTPELQEFGGEGREGLAVDSARSCDPVAPTLTEKG